MTPATSLAAAHSPAHPAFRWTPQWRPDLRAQHRRSDDTTTMCGLKGNLVLAENTDTRCPNCFPNPRR